MCAHVQMLLHMPALESATCTLPCRVSFKMATPSAASAAPALKSKCKIACCRLGTHNTGLDTGLSGHPTQPRQHEQLCTCAASRATQRCAQSAHSKPISQPWKGLLDTPQGANHTYLKVGGDAAQVHHAALVRIEGCAQHAKGSHISRRHTCASQQPSAATVQTS